MSTVDDTSVSGMYVGVSIFWSIQSRKKANIFHKQRLLGDIGLSYISGGLAEWLEDQKIDHIRGVLYHPQT